MHHARLFFQGITTKPLTQYFASQASQTNLVTKIGEERVCDFELFGHEDTDIESIIVLNNQLNRELFSRSMKLTRNVVLADGGADQFYNSQFRDSDKIKAVVGNFDEISPNVLDYYSQRKKQIQYLPNSDLNDFGKAIEYCLAEGWRQIFCFGAFGMRMDQTLACMHYCQKYSRLYPDMDIFLLGKSNLMYFLRKNQSHRIHVGGEYISKFGCGVISFGKAQHVETTGFRYNLGECHKYKKIEWGEFISTSNQIRHEDCTIRSSHDLFFVAKYIRAISQ